MSRHMRGFTGGEPCPRQCLPPSEVWASQRTSDGKTEGGTNLGQELGSVLEVLPVDPGPQVIHDPLLDLLVNPLVCLCLQLQALVVVFPLWGQRREKAAGVQESAGIQKLFRMVTASSS